MRASALFLTLSVVAGCSSKVVEADPIGSVDPARALDSLSATEAEQYCADVNAYAKKAIETFDSKRFGCAVMAPVAAAGTKTGTDTVNKARAEQMIVAMLNAAFEQCWNKPLAGGGVAAPIVTLKWNMNPDGTVAGEAKVVQSDRANPLADQAERSALRAVQTCAPFQLPPDQYNLWREITWKFNPNQTF